MTAFNTYSTGTISIDASATAVVGVGTVWLANVVPGDLLLVSGHLIPVKDVTDDTHLAIDSWVLDAVSAGTNYVVYQTSILRFDPVRTATAVNALINVLNTTGFFVFVAQGASAPDPSLGEEGQNALQPYTGKVWLKTSGAWVFQGIYRGFNVKGAWDSATDYVVGDVVSRDGSSYVAIEDSTDVDPAADGSPPSWTILAEKGDTGATGATGSAGTNAPTYGGTSTTSLTIATGSKAFTTQAGLAYQNGARVRASSAANTSNWMEGVATYSGTTLTITVDKTNGSGTHADWNFNVVGQPGAGDLSSANNLSDVASAATALNNLSGVSFGAAQTLTMAQGQQARANVGAFGDVKVQKFTASGTYTPSTGMLFCIIECVGGGGGGGGCAAATSGQTNGGGGGGGGGYSRVTASAATIGSSQAVTVGAAGSAGTAGNNTGGTGGATTVGTLCVANGGLGGVGAPTGDRGIGGSGGAAGTGDIAVAGADGDPGNYVQTLTSFTAGGAGANSFFGGGAPATRILQTGNAAKGFGGGGSGGSDYNFTNPRAGGAGAPGIAVITEFCTQ